MQDELQQLLREARVIARDAGAAIMEVYEREFEVEHKDDQSPLTEADPLFRPGSAAAYTRIHTQELQRSNQS